MGLLDFFKRKKKTDVSKKYNLGMKKTRSGLLGKLKSIQVKERNKAGYIIKLLMVYENKECLLTNESDIRDVIGKYLVK